MEDLKTSPLFFLLGQGDNPNTVTWTRKARLLWLAVTRLLKERCPHCGTPMWLSHSADNRVAHEHHWRVCYTCQEKAEVEKLVKEKKPGEYLTTRVVPVDGEELPSRSEGYNTMAEPIYPTKV